MFICPYCQSKRKSQNSLTQHQIRCKKNPNHIEVKPSYGMSGKKGANQYTYGAKMSEETKRKISKASSKQTWDRERRKKHSKRMKQAVEENPNSYTKNNVVGRVRNIEYKGKILKGTWELRTAKWLDSQHEVWNNEVSPQVYFWNDSEHLYYPDFYLPEHDLYIEVKGYKRERDEAKWSQFNGTLVIIDKSLINRLEKYTILEIRPYSLVA